MTRIGDHPGLGVRLISSEGLSSRSEESPGLQFLAHYPGSAMVLTQDSRRPQLLTLDFFFISQVSVQDSRTLQILAKNSGSARI